MPETPKRNPSAGGFLIAMGVLGGAVIGFAVGQPTIGLLVGAVTASAIALAMWARDRR